MLEFGFLSISFLNILSISSPKSPCLFLKIILKLSIDFNWSFSVVTL